MDALYVDGDKPHDPRAFFHWQEMRVVEHRPMGPVTPDALSRAELYLTPRQERDEQVSGHELCQELRGKSHFNANYLDAVRSLLNSQSKEEAIGGKLLNSLVPLSFCVGSHGWHLYLFCWGTLYEDEAGKRYVRYLCRMRNSVYFGFQGLDVAHFRVNCPALLVP